jgi:hypothetical protein
MQMTVERSFIGRIVGVAKLDPAAYDDIVNDRSAMTGAALVVGLTAVASAVVAAVEIGVAGLIVAVIMSVVCWFLYAISAWYTGVELIRGQRVGVTIADVLRVTGFAQVPGILVILGLIPTVGTVIAIIVWIWTFVTSVVAIRQVFDTSTARAVAISLVGTVVLIIILAIAGIFLEFSSAFVV